jgi:hypothetical protein
MDQANYGARASRPDFTAGSEVALATRLDVMSPEPCDSTSSAPLICARVATAYRMADLAASIDRVGGIGSIARD